MTTKTKMTMITFKNCKFITYCNWHKMFVTIKTENQTIGYKLVIKW